MSSSLNTESAPQLTRKTSFAIGSIPGGLRLALLGPPGSGKGTQATKLGRNMHVAHLATGDMLRAALARQSSTGKEAEQYMKRGELVPDDVMVRIISSAIGAPECRSGFVLDGFPRTVVQAQKLDEMLAVNGQKLSCVIELKVGDEQVMKRILGRWVHTPSGRTYNDDFSPPKVPGRDDITGEPLSRRSDDNEETIKRRLATYHRITEPVAKYYREKGQLYSVDASQPSDQVWTDIVEICLRSTMEMSDLS